MRRHPRTRRFLKWAGVVVCVGLGFAAAMSGGWALARVQAQANSFRAAGVSEGSAYMMWAAEPGLPSGWYIRRIHDASGETWRYSWWFRQHEGVGSGFIVIPLWPVFLVLLGSVLWLFHRDRKLARVGCCRNCGYDLRGTKHNACPECGAPT